MSAPLTLLNDVKILALTQFLLGPAAAQYLADMGADVVKVEPPGRGPYERRWAGGGTYLNGESAFFMLAHRNVRSVTLDLKHPDGREAACRLAAGVDVVVANFRPGVLDRLGLGYADVAEVNENVIYATASGYGENSPYRHLPGQDLLLQARTGLAAHTGRAGEPPTAAGAAVVDQHAASLLAMGILGALHHRACTGQGQHLEVTMVQAALDLQTEPVVYHLNGGIVQRPTEPLGSSFHEAPYGFYQTKDGYLALSLTPIAVVREALGGPDELADLEDPSHALPRREEIHAALAPLLAWRTTAELLDLFQQHGVWCAPVNDYDQTFTDPVVTHVDPLTTIDHPAAGPVTLLKHPIRYSSGEAEAHRHPPTLGEHTEEILAEAGYSQAEIEALRRSGAT